MSLAAGRRDFQRPERFRLGNANVGVIRVNGMSR